MSRDTKVITSKPLELRNLHWGGYGRRKYEKYVIPEPVCPD